MTNITILRLGEHFMFKGFEWVCLDPNHPDGGLLAIMAEPWARDVKFCPSDKFTDERGNWNNYRTSNVRGILSDMANSVFEKKVCCRIPLTLLPTTEIDPMELYMTLFSFSRVMNTASTVSSFHTTTVGCGLLHRGTAVIRILTRTVRTSSAQ